MSPVALVVATVELVVIIDGCWDNTIGERGLGNVNMALSIWESMKDFR